MKQIISCLILVSVCSVNAMRVPVLFTKAKKVVSDGRRNCSSNVFNRLDSLIETPQKREALQRFIDNQNKYHQTINIFMFAREIADYKKNLDARLVKPYNGPDNCEIEKLLFYEDKRAICSTQQELDQLLLSFMDDKK